MNALVGSASIGLWRCLRGDGLVAKKVGMKLPPLLALTINMGVAPLLFLQVNYGHFDYVSSVLMGGWWLMIIAVLMFSYYGFYAYKFKYDSMSAVRRTALYALSLAGLLYVGFMFSNNMTFMIRPEIWPEYFANTESFLNLSDPVLYPRFLHFMVGAVAIGGLYIALMGKWRKNDEFLDIGMTWFTRSTIVNLGVGLWFFMALPSKIMHNFMGANLPATLTFTAALASAAMMLFAGFRKNPTSSAVWAVLTVFFMTCTRHWLRTFYLDPWFSIESTPITHQYGSLYLFLGFLVVGLAAMGYMVKLYLKSCEGRG
jgi:hypothetical protein